MLEISALSKSFGLTEALADISFSVNPGEIVGFVGRNGSGKTTTMRSILGLIEFDAGTIHFNGRPISLADNQSIGYMPEERGLYAKSKVSDQLQYFAQLQGMSSFDAKVSVKELLARFEIPHFADRQLTTLSLGNQQRIQFIAALVHRPSLLVLDEPFNGLDPVAMSQLTEILREKTAVGAAVLFSSHQLDLVSHLCDRIVIIDAGKVVAEDSLANLQRREKIQYLITGSQLPQDLAATFGDHITYRSPNEITALFNRDSFESEKERLLSAILADGSLDSFSEVKPTLSEIYRELVSHE